MNTEEALEVVNKYKTGLESDVADKGRLIEAYQVLEDYLNGILDTSSEDMKDKQAELDQEKTKVEQLKQDIDDRDKKIRELEAELDKARGEKKDV